MTTEMNQPLQLAALTVLRDAVDERIAALRTNIQTTVTELNTAYGVKSLDVKVENETVAGITLTERKQSFVVDEDIFTNWVALRYPTEVQTVTVVRDGLRKSLLDGAIIVDDVVILEATGEIIEGLTPKPSSTTITLRFKSAGRETVAKALGKGTVQLNELFIDQPLAIEPTDD